MLHTFKYHEEYFENVIAAVFKIIITMPQFNNIKDINELCSIYFRKVAISNISLSSKICNDCFHIVDFLLDVDDVSYIISTFDDYRHAYHYMALLTHLRRMENKYKLRSPAPDMHYNICNLLSYNQLHGY